MSPIGVDEVAAEVRPASSRNTAEGLIVAAAFVVIGAISFAVQPPTFMNQGKAWDGVHYYTVADQLDHGARPSTTAPYVYRLGTPYLVSRLFPDRLLSGFLVVNVFANAVLVGLLVIWLRLYIANWKLRVLLILLYMAPWYLPVRFTFFGPVSVDNWGHVFILAGLIGIEKLRSNPSSGLTLAMALLCFAGVFFRESVLLIPVLLLFANNPLAWDKRFTVPLKVVRRPPVRFLVPLLAGVGGVVCTRLLVTPTGEYSFLGAAVYWLCNKSLPLYVHALFVSFGVIPYVLVFFWREAFAFLRGRQFHAALLGCVAVLAFVGGSDTERILGWGMPVVLVLFGKIVERRRQLLDSPALAACLTLCHAVSQRFFLATPDAGAAASGLLLLAPVGPDATLLQLWASHTDLFTRVVSLTQYLILGVLFLLWLRYRSLKEGSSFGPVGQCT